MAFFKKARASRNIRKGQIWRLQKKFVFDKSFHLSNNQQLKLGEKVLDIFNEIDSFYLYRFEEKNLVKYFELRSDLYSAAKQFFLYANEANRMAFMEKLIMEPTFSRIELACRIYRDYQGQKVAIASFTETDQAGNEMGTSKQYATAPPLKYKPEWLENLTAFGDATNELNSILFEESLNYARRLERFLLIKCESTEPYQIDDQSVVEKWSNILKKLTFSGLIQDTNDEIYRAENLNGRLHYIMENDPYWEVDVAEKIISLSEHISDLLSSLRADTHLIELVTNPDLVIYASAYIKEVYPTLCEIDARVDYDFVINGFSQNARLVRPDYENPFNVFLFSNNSPISNAWRKFSAGESFISCQPNFQILQRAIGNAPYNKEWYAGILEKGMKLCEQGQHDLGNLYLEKFVNFCDDILTQDKLDRLLKLNTYQSIKCLSAICVETIENKKNIPIDVALTEAQLEQILDMSGYHEGKNIIVALRQVGAIGKEIGPNLESYTPARSATQRYRTDVTQATTLQGMNH